MFSLEPHQNASKHNGRERNTDNQNRKYQYNEAGLCTMEKSSTAIRGTTIYTLALYPRYAQCKRETEKGGYAALYIYDDQARALFFIVK